MKKNRTVNMIRSNATTDRKDLRKSHAKGKSIGKNRRGFAIMKPEQLREICRKGGLTVSRNRLHMSDIGMIGGQNSQANRRRLRRKKAA